MATRTANKGRRTRPTDTPWKGKTPSQRRREQTQSAAAQPTIGFVTVSVKLRPEEKAELKRVCGQLGMTPNKAMRVMARKASGFLEVDAQSIANLEKITSQIIGVSRNINQIAKAANRTHDPEYLAFMEDRMELSKELRVLQRQLQDITRVALRRSDGLTKLREASTPS